MVYNYEKVDQKLLVPQIEDQLMIYIQQEQIAVGSILPSEHKLSERFGVGRSTVREAIKSLVTRGILDVKRGSGTFVKNPELDNGDPLGLSKIEIDIEARKIAVIGINGEKRTPEEIDDILAKRKANWKGFTSKYKKGLPKLYAHHAQSPMKGAYME